MRAAAIGVAGLFAAGCRYTWGIEHAPLISGPGPGSHWVRVRAGGREYDVDVHLPRDHSGGPPPSERPVPRLIVLHGFSGTGPGMERRTDLSRLADSAGFAVAYPNGQANAQGRRAWSGSAATSPDVELLPAIVDSVNRRIPIDRGRIYLAGFSNGAMMTYRAALALPATFAAVGVVAGNLPVGAARDADSIAVPLLAVHGMLDSTVAFDSRGDRGASAPRSVRTWAALNACNPTPAVDTLSGGEILRTSYSSCRANGSVVLYATVHGRHQWPNAHTREAPLATSEILWRFLSQYRARDSLVAVHRRP